MVSSIMKQISVTRVRDAVEVASEDSFPASDPPSWTPVVGTGAPCRVRGRAGTVVQPIQEEAPTQTGPILSIHLSSRGRGPTGRRGAAWHKPM